jgi:rubrerythrin
MSGMDAGVVEALIASRVAEKEQALFYRALAVLSEDAGDDEMSQRFHDLHADEQHHLSRITARLLELGHQPPDLSHLRAEPLPLAEWEAATRAREAAEVERYATLAAMELDPQTRALVEEMLEVERRHAAVLGGKWTLA